MPSRNSVKIYVPDSYYHIYNRGVEKRKIFQDDSDYKVFLSYIKASLSPPITDILITQGQSLWTIKRQPKNFYSEIDLLCYVLIKNHFHLLIYQKGQSSIESFVRSILTRYSMYFNKKYKRVGHLFQGRFKAKRIDNEEYLLHLSRYIHINPIKHTGSIDYAYSSYPEYLLKRNTAWIKPNRVLSYFNQALGKEFSKTLSYEKFVEDTNNDPKANLEEFILETETEDIN